VTRLIFLGPPGSGKGTQAAVISSTYGFPHISTGDILRQAVQQGTDLGLQAQAYMDKGDLVPDSLILGIVRDRLGEDDARKGWLLDGFPRTVDQATYLESLLHDIGQSCDRVLNLQVSDDSIVQRLLGRGRKDDNEDVIRHRLQVYREQTSPLIDFYQSREKLVSVNGDRAVDEVTHSLKAVVHSLIH
jgi:adenylate kinase